MTTTFTPGPTPNSVKTADGKVLTVPDGWVLLPPGDAALTRRVKAAGDRWGVAEKKGRKVFSRGVWAPAATIERIRAELEAERSTESFAKKKEADAKRREKAQESYVEDFTGAVVTFLAFHPAHADLAQRLAKVVADHATPVGSGTVARTKRIPLEARGSAMRTIIALAAALLAVSSVHAQDFRNVTCEGTYPHHLQGICADKEAIYWSFTKRS